MPADNKIKDFMEGRQARLVVFQDSVPKSLDWKTWSIKPNVTKHADGVNGEKRDRLSKTLNYYEITAQMYTKDALFLKTWLEAQAADDALTAPLPQEGAVRLYPKDGTRNSFILDGLIIDDFDLNQGGRAEKIMTTVNMRCEDLKEAKAV